MTEVEAIAAKYGSGYGGSCFACGKPGPVVFSAGDFAILCSCGAVTEMRRDGGVFVELPKMREQRESPLAGASLQLSR